MTEKHYAYVLIEDEKWWNRRLNRNKEENVIHAFVRRGRVGPKDAQKILFYVKQPMKQIKGFGEFLERITGTSDELWNLHGIETVFESKEEYDSFVNGRSHVTFVRFKNMEELDKPIGSNIIYAAKSIKKMPQGGMYLSLENLNSMIEGELKNSMMQSQSAFEPKEFVENQIQQIRNQLGKERALVAVSGGVDSSTCAALVYQAIGNNLLCVILDDAFMREGESEKVATLLSQPPLNLPMKILNVQERFLTEMKGLRDAEEKRKVFRETFYRILSETAKGEGIRYLVQGTILADIMETAGGVKTQHNVLSQIGISTEERYGFQLVEPLKTLFKGQVREVARHLGLSKEISERQPFPGPGLSVRVVGEIRKDKLETLKKATAIAEEKLAKHEPSQYFAVILDNVEKAHSALELQIELLTTDFLKVSPIQVSATMFEDKATGVREGKRVYGEISALKVLSSKGDIHQPDIQSLISLQSKIVAEKPLMTRVFYTIREKSPKQPYVVAVRAVKTQDFLTAEVADIPWTTLNEIAEEVLNACSNISAVYYDVTPKPTATIEME